MDERIEALEVKVAFQEHTIAQLDAIVRSLHDEVDRLRVVLGEVEAQVRSLEPEPENARPPHYG